jgi:hypothetical protein
VVITMAAAWPLRQFIQGSRKKCSEYAMRSLTALRQERWSLHTVERSNDGAA